MGAFFFACRSCEYLKVKGKRRTKTIRQDDIEFRLDRSILPHDSPHLHRANTVTITFRDQKNRVKDASRTAWATSDPTACPVEAFARIIRKVRALPSSSDDSFIYNYAAPTNGTFRAVTDASMIILLRTAVTLIGEAVLGYKAADVGTHSIRSGCAMALVLSHHAAWRIMLVGRWKSQAFLVYIREQIQQFSKGVSERMTQNPDFYHVPDIDSNDQTNPTTDSHVSTLDGVTLDGRPSIHTDMLSISFLG